MKLCRRDHQALRVYWVREYSPAVACVVCVPVSVWQGVSDDAKREGFLDIVTDAAQVQGMKMLAVIDTVT